MHLVTALRSTGETFPGVLTDNRVADLSVVGLPTMATVLEAGLARVSLLLSDAPIVTDVTMVAPLRPRSVIGTGTNYRSHVAEMGGIEPKRPTANFVKLPDSVCGPGDTIEIPHQSLLDYEGEIAIVIGTPVRNADHDQARRAILGLCLANDLSARDAPTPHLTTAKSSRGFCPLGPRITTLDELDLDDISFQVSVNGEARQFGHTLDLVHSILDIVASFCHSLPLWPGDVILTGSPSGVGVAQDPPQFLSSGDVVEIASDQLGVLTNTFTQPTTAKDSTMTRQTESEQR